MILNLLVNAEHAIQGAGTVGPIRIRAGLAGQSAFVEATNNGPVVSPELAGNLRTVFTTKPVDREQDWACP